MSKESFFRPVRLLFLFKKWEEEKTNREKRSKDLSSLYSGKEARVNLIKDLRILLKHQFIRTKSFRSTFGTFPRGMVEMTAPYFLTQKGREELETHYLPLKEKIEKMFQEEQKG